MSFRQFLFLSIATIVAFVGTKAYVRAESPYQSAFDKLSEEYVVSGYPDGSPGLEDPLSRVAGLKAVLRAQERFAPQVVWFTENLPSIPLFRDLTQSAWYSPFVEVGFLEGIVTGYSDETFRPAASLTVEQALVLIVRAYQKDELTYSYRTSDSLPNIPDQWFTHAVSMAHARNLIRPGSTLALGKPITRGQFFDMLYRLRTIEKQGIYAFIDEHVTVQPIALRPPSEPEPEPQPAPEPHPPLPLSITPIPFGPSDDFVLNLPPPSTTYGPELPPAKAHEYASTKRFAITIPSLNLHDIEVFHPDDPFTSEGILSPLKQGLGHLFAYPGNEGKTMIYGHSSSWPWDISEFTKIFRKINLLANGERVYITYEGRLHVYEVSKKQVISASDVTPFNDDGTSELILYTCWPPDSIKQRYLVHAMEVETVALGN